MRAGGVLGSWRAGGGSPSQCPESGRGPVLSRRRKRDSERGFRGARYSGERGAAAAVRAGRRDGTVPYWIGGRKGGGCGQGDRVTPFAGGGKRETVRERERDRSFMEWQADPGGARHGSSARFSLAADGFCGDRVLPRRFSPKTVRRPGNCPPADVAGRYAVDGGRLKTARFAPRSRRFSRGAASLLWQMN